MVGGSRRLLLHLTGHRRRIDCHLVLRGYEGGAASTTSWSPRMGRPASSRQSKSAFQARRPGSATLRICRKRRFAQAAYQAPSGAIARELAASVVPTPALNDFEACIAHLRSLATHSPGVRKDNFLERLFVEECQRRLKTIPNAFGESALLKLMFGAPIRAAERWKSIRNTESDDISRWQKKLDQE
jgi:hypothetical protein